MSGYTLPVGQPMTLPNVLSTQGNGVATQVLLKVGAARVTLFVFEANHGFGVHTSPFDALVFVVVGAVAVSIDGVPTTVRTSSVILLPRGVPHSLRAAEPSQLLLITLGRPDGARDSTTAVASGVEATPG